MELKQAKILGGLGAIFILCFVIPVIGWILSIVGFILTAIAIKEISDKVKDKPIFTNYLISIILFFVSGVTAIIGSIIFFFSAVVNNIDKFKNFNNWNGFNDFGIRDFNFFRGSPEIRDFLTTIGSKIWILILILAIAWVIFVVAGYFTKSSFDRLVEKIKIDNFKTAGLLIFIGSILTILFGVGFIIILVGVIFEIISFFSLPDIYEETQLT
ncbi:MAG TPA: DUF996 domain-containing protein [Caldisericia bacterium]|nr:DUF996 domain-containing protein [Caldisericia bacterium]HOL83126.1 DUF996 domain-containing protein [Caldisericia bacterium]HPP43494.1 DUF996 domain-containing protein [Caldisericia bacterium]HRT37125.1 DUF996 domain-containing protein [Caldisericia bacterium]